MTTVNIYPPRSREPASSPLPQLLQTPSGLALLELQGTINLPSQSDSTEDSSPSLPEGIDVGRLDFPDYDPNAEGSAWMRRVHMYIGQHQRLTGEVKKLPRPIAVVRKRGGGGGDDQNDIDDESGDLEIAEVVKYKILFSNRPEPVGTSNTT
ncbi:ctf8 domain-containing protein [Sarocladium implicatum]|nr:ctf8 domain-containing protein [Sarocladium implicatum]